MVNLMPKNDSSSNDDTIEEDDIDLTNANFGFQKVSKSTHKNLVQKVFSNVAGQYDLMNDLMSLGIHRLWKDELVAQVLNLNGKILDMAGGSGDLAFRILKRAKLQNKQPQIVICDINPDMLEIAQNKAIDNNLLEHFNYVCADAEHLPFADNSFDYYIIAFGIRNITDINKALKEALRVLKPMGKFLCLEFSQVENVYLKSFYEFYLFNLIPKLGKFVVNKETDYEYLAQSISLFPKQRDFQQLIIDVGFENVKYKNLSYGIVAIHTAYKI